MAVLQTYQTTAGNREDIYDVLQLVSPEETPIFTRLPDSQATAITHSWVEYTLASGSGNADIEGATATGASSSSKARLLNYTQIMSKTGAVSGTQRTVNNVGSEEEFAFEMKKKMLEWKLGAESDLILQISGAGSATTARSMTGLIDAIQTNRVTGSATTVALRESDFNDLLQKIFEAGAVADTVYVNGFNKRRISQFVTSNTRFLNMGGDNKLTNRVSIYESDFGTMEIVLARYVSKTVGIMVKADLFRKAWLRKPVTFPLAKRGDLDEFEIVGEWTLEYLNQRAGGILSAFASSTS
jgi:hypothetical protein